MPTAVVVDGLSFSNPPQRLYPRVYILATRTLFIYLRGRHCTRHVFSPSYALTREKLLRPNAFTPHSEQDSLNFGSRIEIYITKLIYDNISEGKTLYFSMVLNKLFRNGEKCQYF